MKAETSIFVWLKTAGFSYLLLHSICYKVVLVEVYKKNWPHIDMELEKGNSILIAFLDIMDLSCNLRKTPLYAHDRMSKTGK